jgi:two-component system sensor histidine kinase PilS (NtrC family)
MTAFFEPPHETTALEILTMFMNSGTFLIVAIVAGGLAERFRATHRELETQRKDLRDLQAFNDLLFHAAGTGLIALDRDHAITAFNEAAAEITGVPAHRAIGGPWTALFGDAIALEAIERTLEEDPRASTLREVNVRRPDGTTAPVRMIFFALRSGEGHRLGLIAVCEDLSPIREMEARVRQADRLASLGRMAANIAHEIRNPLGSLTGAVEALAGGDVPGDQRERLAQIAVRESGRLNEIIKNFLDYARPAPLARTAVDVTEVLDEIAVLLEHRAAAGRHKIVRDYVAPLVWWIDAQQFRQALWNLCLNAVEAMPEGGELRLAAVVHRRRLQISVADTGEGIPAAELAHVFEPFFSTKADGSGLGLALVHRIVQDHGGEIDVRSVPGFGTIFTIDLPHRDG